VVKMVELGDGSHVFWMVQHMASRLTGVVDCEGQGERVSMTMMMMMAALANDSWHHWNHPVAVVGARCCGEGCCCIG